MFRTIMPFWLIGLLSCCWLSFFLAAQGLPWHFDEQRYYEDYHALSAEVETPHLSWAKESVWSDLKVLIIAPSWGQRESVELQQRYDFQVSTLMTLRHNAFAGLTSVGSPLSPEQVFAQFESELLPKKYDVIVVSRTSWGLFPSAYRYEILRKVYEEGSGLLLINVGKHQELDQLWKREAWQPEIEIEELSALSYVNRGNAAKTNISGRIFGKGRVLRLDWRGMSAQMILTPWPAKNNFDLEWEYEHYLALCSKAILACADKINDSLEKPSAALQLQSGLREQQLSFEIKPGANEGASLELLAFSKELPQGHQLGKFAYDQRKLGGIVNANLPAGAYVLLALSRNKQGKLCGYQYFPLQVQSNLYITDIKLEKENLAKAGDMVRLKVELSGLQAGLPALRLEVYDIDRRMLVQQEKTVSASNNLSFEFPAPYPLSSSLFSFEITLGGIAKQSGSFTVQGRKRPVFSLAAWAESQSCYISQRFYESMRKNGVDGIYYSNARGDHAEAAYMLAKTGLFGLPNYYYYAPKPDKAQQGFPLNQNSLNDPEYLAQQSQKMLALSEIWSKYDVYCYTDGSDKKRGGNSFDEPSIAAFKLWMQNRYQSVEKLNQEMGSQYNSFAELKPLPLEMARKQNALPLWIEYNRFFEERFLDYFKVMLQLARQQDLNGKAYLGPDGFGRLDPFEFCGMYELLQTVNYFNLYTYQDPPQMEIGRSLLQYCPNVSFRSIYAGSYGSQYMNYEFMRSIPWFMLLHGYNGFFWYMGNGKLSYSSEGCLAFMPDLRPSEGFMVAAEQIQEMRKGTANLVAVSKRRHDGIAVLYSNDSVAAATVDKQENLLRQSLSTLQQILEDTGLQYDYIPPEKIEDGALQENYRLLFLPCILSLSENCLAGIERFVQAGGMVIADQMPGKYDGLLRKGPQEKLQDRFAAKQEWRLFDWKNYGRLRRQAKAGKARREEILELMQGKLTRLSSFAENGLPNVEKIEYELPGAGLLLAALNYSAEEQALQLELPGDKFVYDLRQGQELGQLTERQLTMRGGEVQIFALLDEKLPETKIELLPKTESDPDFRLLCNNGRQSNAYHLQVFDAAGNERAEYADTVLNNEVYTLRPALNDPRGTWTIKVREAISGKISQIQVKR
ncbi:MAG: beta-galactosidase [Lentisphaeria bacterium]|nr:beta-galactosidase [Lentisphaeria bacterium]